MNRLFPITGALLLAASFPLAAARQAPLLELFVDRTVDEQRNTCSARSGCTLRDALLIAEAHGGPVRIRAALPNPPYTIRVERALPAIGDTVDLDLSTEPDACPRPGLHLDGSGIEAAGVHGLVFNGSGSHIRGVAVTGFPGHGILLQGRGNRVTCSHVGVLQDGFTGAPNGGDGIRVWEAADSRLGGTDPADGLLASANRGWGVRIADSLLTRQDHVGIGIDASGRGTLPNGDLTNPDARADVPAVDGTDNPEPVGGNLSDVMGKQLAKALDEPSAAVTEADLIGTYGALVTRRREAPPETFEDLLRALAEHPELQAAFIADLAAASGLGEQEALDQILPWLERFDWAVPGFGRDVRVAAGVDRDLTSELLITLPPDDYTLSDIPEELTAAELDDPPTSINALAFRGLHTYGPASKYSSLSSLSAFKRCNGGGATCTWPVAYDVLPLSFTLYYDSITLSPFQLSNMVAGNGYRLDLRLNGQPLDIGPPPSQQPGNQGQNDYWVASLPASACPIGLPCIAVTIRARSRLEGTPLPWVIELEVDQQVAVPPTPVLDKFGQVVIVSEGLAPFVAVQTTVTPNPTSHLSWFEGALAETFQSERCQSCHSLKTFQALFAHHDAYPALSSWWGGEQDFYNVTQIQMEPSAYVPGGHVITCIHCHYHTVPLTDDNGDPFHETQWKAPAADLDIDWSLKTPAQMCQRVVTNLPTFALRHEHFHEDARLFWAIQDPQPPPGGPASLQQAEPKSWDLFLDRIDLWNWYGAPCP